MKRTYWYLVGKLGNLVVVFDGNQIYLAIADENWGPFTRTLPEEL